MSNQIFKSLLSALFMFILAGCAHSIEISPNLARLERLPSDPPRLSSNIGYYIPAETISLEVITPGGGGDSVKYYPYRDMEAGFQKILSNVFTSVVKLVSLPDEGHVANGIDYVISPTVVTNSGGGGPTYMPKSFTVDLTSQIRNREGKPVTDLRVVGTGSVDGYMERLSDRGIAGRQAMEDALLKMQAALREANFHGTEKEKQQPAVTNKDVTADRLAHLKELKDQGLITEKEYEEKRKAILDSL